MKPTPFPSLVLLLACCLAAASPVRAHSLQHTVSHTSAVVVTFMDDDGDSFAGEACEVVPPGTDTPLLTGRTDRRGRVAFTPDRTGDWRVRVWSEDGHGDRVVIPVDELLSTAEPSPARPGPGTRAVVGVSLLFGVFGLVALALGRKRT